MIILHGYEHRYHNDFNWFCRFKVVMNMTVENLIQIFVSSVIVFLFQGR